MFGTVTPTLAVAVTEAGGFGFLSGGFDFSPNSLQPSKLSQDLGSVRTSLKLPEGSPLPIGVGFLTFSPANFIPAVAPLLTEHKPLAIWLFAPASREDHARIIPGLKELGESWGLKVWVQIGSVQAAQEAVEDGADVIVAQGIDAGGHQWAQGASIVSLVPEVKDLLRERFHNRDIPVLAAGGIADGRGLASALTLGAEGVVMGTRFVASHEAASSQELKETVVRAKDGGRSTIKSTVHDKVSGNDIWPELYDGRALVGDSFRDAMEGMSIEENRERFLAGGIERYIIWSGTSVGSIGEITSAEKIVKDTQDSAKMILRSFREL